MNHFLTHSHHTLLRAHVLNYTPFQPIPVPIQHVTLFLRWKRLHYLYVSICKWVNGGFILFFWGLITFFDFSFNFFPLPLRLFMNALYLKESKTSLSRLDFPCFYKFWGTFSLCISTKIKRYLSINSPFAGTASVNVWKKKTTMNHKKL